MTDVFSAIKPCGADLNIIAYYESWVVPAGVPSALADILGAELGPIIDFVKERGGLCDKINS